MTGRLFPLARLGEESGGEGARLGLALGRAEGRFALGTCSYVLSPSLPPLHFCGESCCALQKQDLNPGLAVPKPLSSWGAGRERGTLPPSCLRLKWGHS